MTYAVQFSDPATGQTATLNVTAGDAFEAEELAQAWVRRDALLDEPDAWTCRAMLAEQSAAAA